VGSGNQTDITNKMPQTTIARQINLLASRKNTPLSVLIELTYRCPHSCYYCYQKEYPKVKELSFAKWRAILRELADSGVLYLTFSGGEPFTRKDFLPIVEFARSLDFGISIITNGALINRRTVDQLAALCIMDIGISFLAADARMHDLFSGVKGSFCKARESLDLCLEKGIKTMIKHTVSSLNFGEFLKLRKLATETGAFFECDCFTMPSKAGAVSPYALSEEKFHLFLKKMKVVPFPCSKKSDLSAQLHCDAGRSVAGITPNGTVVPCIQLAIPLGNLKKTSFKSVWNSLAAQRFREQEKQLSKQCILCKTREYCSRCHGIALLEAGDWRGKAKSLCLYAAAMKKL
jgi:radical SAM protein with 4Fe4S-binding SPASM domain